MIIIGICSGLHGRGMSVKRGVEGKREGEKEGGEWQKRKGKGQRKGE